MTRGKWVTVLGQGRGGTTVLQYAITGALREAGIEHLAVYERYSRDMFDAFRHHARHRWVAAKFLANHRPRRFGLDLLEPFDLRFQVVRDPRDVAVSVLLFGATHMAKRTRESLPREFERWARMLEAKERDPRAVSMVELYEECHKILRRSSEWVWKERFEATVDIYDQIDADLVRLEDLLAGRHTVVSERLGLPLALRQPSKEKRYVLRSGESTWRHWFTPEDVDYFRPRMRRYMERFGYEDDWELAAEPVIAPEEASLYARRTLEEMRTQWQQLRSGDVPSELLRARASHGNPGSALKLATRLVREEGDPEEIRELSVLAACAGLPRGMKLATKVFAKGIGGPVDRDEARYWKHAYRDAVKD
jgi:hypothetical protein